MIISIVFPRTPFLVLVVMMMVVVCCFVPSKGRLFRAMATLCRQKMLSAFSRIRTKKELPNVQPQPIKRLEDLDKKRATHRCVQATKATQQVYQTKDAEKLSYFLSPTRLSVFAH